MLARGPRTCSRDGLQLAQAGERIKIFRLSAPFLRGEMAALTRYGGGHSVMKLRRSNPGFGWLDSSVGLDASKRREIAESVVSGRKSGADMAQLYGVSQPTVSRIVAQHRVLPT